MISPWTRRWSFSCRAPSRQRNGTTVQDVNGRIILSSCARATLQPKKKRRLGKIRPCTLIKLITWRSLTLNRITACRTGSSMTRATISEATNPMYLLWWINIMRRRSSRISPWTIASSIWNMETTECLDCPKTSLVSPINSSPPANIKASPSNATCPCATAQPRAPAVARMPATEGCRRPIQTSQLLHSGMKWAHGASTKRVLGRKGIHVASERTTSCTSSVWAASWITRRDMLHSSDATQIIKSIYYQICEKTLIFEVLNIILIYILYIYYFI